MLYKIAHFLQEKFTFIWDLIEILNAGLFSLRYGRKLKGIQPILTKHQGDFIVREANLKDVDAIVTFFEVQPKESFDFFKPHPFDASTTRKLIKNKSYLFFIVLGQQHVRAETQGARKNMPAVVVGMLANKVNATRCKIHFLCLLIIRLSKSLSQFFQFHDIYFMMFVAFLAS